MPKIRYAMQTRFVDVDGFGHVNNAVFLSYLENAREHLYRELGLAEKWGSEVFVLVAHQEIEYRRPLSFQGETIAVDVWVSRIGRSSFDLGYHVLPMSGDQGLAYAVANTGMVVADRETARGVPIADAARTLLESVSDDPADLRILRSAARP